MSTTGIIVVSIAIASHCSTASSRRGAERFIISGGNHTYREVFTTIANAFGKKPPHKKVTPVLAAIVWRLEAIKSLFSRKNPLLTRETAHTAQAKVFFQLPPCGRNKYKPQYFPIYQVYYTNLFAHQSLLMVMLKAFNF